MRARDIMNPDVITIRTGASVAAAARLLVDHRINAMPVLDSEGRVVGMIGIRDVLRVPHPSHSQTPILRWDSLQEKVEHLRQTIVDQVVKHQRLVSVDEDCPIVEVASIMANRGVHPLLVLKDGALLGVIGRADVARTLLALGEEGVAPGGVRVDDD